MRFVRLHRWPRSARSAIHLQAQLAARVMQSPLMERARLLAGADAAFSPDRERVVAGVVLWDAETRRVIERRVACARCTFPYVPGLLSFRELPAVLRAFRMVRTRPDVVLCDAHGRSHPRRFGLACHLGLWLDLPTIGCAKSRLCGKHGEPGPARGAEAELTHRGEIVGCVLRTRGRVRPVYVSVGHRCDLASAVQVVRRACTQFRLPEPARLAHQLVTESRDRCT